MGIRNKESPAKACGLLHEFASSHNIASFTVKPAVTANMKEYFVTTNRKVMDTLLQVTKKVL